MSATMHLYTVNKDVTFNPGPFYSYKLSEIDSKMKESTQLYFKIKEEADKKFGKDYTEEKEKWMQDEHDKVDPLFTGSFSDNKEHSTFEFNPSNRRTEGRNKRYGKYMKLAKKYFKDYIQPPRGRLDQRNYLIVDEIQYAQGWFFNKILFKKNNSIYYAFNKESSIKLLNRMFLITNESVDIYNKFYNKINDFSNEDRFIFEISF